MIVKINRWKTGEFKKLLEYIDSDKGRGRGATGIYHNITVPTLENAQHEFLENDRYRQKRKSGVVIYHEILSFHENDSQFLSPEILEDISRKYIALRGENALCFSKPHVNDKHFHIHFMFSGTECFSSKTLRLDNKKLRRVKRDIEKYQMERYPELTSSIVYHNERQKAEKKSDREYQLKKRTGKESDKDFLITELTTLFNKCTGFDSFVELVRSNGFICYEYRNKIKGVIYNGRKFRFSTLGFDKERFLALQDRISILQNYRETLKRKQLHNIMKSKYISETSKIRDEAGDALYSGSEKIVLRKRELRKLQRGNLFRKIRR